MREAFLRSRIWALLFEDPFQLFRVVAALLRLHQPPYSELAATNRLLGGLHLRATIRLQDQRFTPRQALVWILPACEQTECSTHCDHPPQIRNDDLALGLRVAGGLLHRLGRALAYVAEPSGEIRGELRRGICKNREAHFVLQISVLCVAALARGFPAQSLLHERPGSWHAGRAHRARRS